MTFRWILTRFFTSWLVRLIIPIKIYNLQKIPKKGPFLLASNHISFLDPPLYGFVSSWANREIFFLAKSGLFEVNVWFSWIIRFFHAMTIDTSGDKNKNLALIKKLKLIIKHNFGILIFPEGTRSKTKCLLPFKPGVGYLSLKYNIPVIPAYIHNANLPVKDIIFKRKPIIFIFDDAIYPQSYPNNKKGYIYLTRDVEKSVSKLKKKINGGELNE